MKCRSIRRDGPRVFLHEEDLPPLKDNEFLIRTAVSLPSVGTELAVLSGHGSKGTRLRYSCVGRVEAAGPAATGLRVGQRVYSLAPHADCYVSPSAPKPTCRTTRTAACSTSTTCCAASPKAG